MSNKSLLNSSKSIKKKLKESMDPFKAKEILEFSGYHFKPEDDILVRKFIEYAYKNGEQLDDLSDDEFKNEFENFKYEEYEGSLSESEQLDEMTTNQKNVQYPTRHSIKEDEEDIEDENELDESTRSENLAKNGRMRVFEDDEDEFDHDNLDDEDDKIILDDCDLNEDDNMSHEEGEDLIHESKNKNNRLISLTEDKFLLQDVDDDEDDTKINEDEVNIEDDTKINEDEVNIEDDDEDIDIETPYSDDEELNIDVDGNEPEENNNISGGKSLFSLDELKGMVQSILSDMNQNPSNTGNATQPLTDSKPSLDTLSNESVISDEEIDPNQQNILDTEFQENDESISLIDQDDESYLSKINGNPDHVGVDGNVARGVDGLNTNETISDAFVNDIDNSEEIDDDMQILPPVEPGYEDSDEELDDTDLNEVENGDFSLPDNKKIKVIIQGWMITEGEIKYLHKIIKENGGLLRALKSSRKDALYVLVEANNKFHTIRYDDRSKYESVTPWSVKNEKFLTLKETVNYIKEGAPKKQKVSDKERFFQKLVKKDNLIEREINNFKESDIFEDFRSKTNYVPSWNIKPAGALNLKNGLNEKFSRITQHTPEVKNTLFKTNDGNYYMIKGNISEGSKPGTKRHLVDYENKKDYGVGKVIGVYENSMRGLGKVMEKIQRTSIPLLVWK